MIQVAAEAGSAAERSKAEIAIAATVVALCRWALPGRDGRGGRRHMSFLRFKNFTSTA
jgi:hypothetical protein